MNHSRYALSFPVITGEVVTEGHAKYCRANGHAIHKGTDGTIDMFCPRCGDKIDGSDDLTPAQDATSVALNTNDTTEAPTMRTYAEYLNTMTVKTLNEIAKGMKLKGYSKLRKAVLVEFIDNAIHLDFDVFNAETAVVEFLSVDNPADVPAIVEIMAETVDAEVDDLYDILFSAELSEPAPVKPTESPVEPVFSAPATPVKASAIRIVSKALSAPVEELPTLEDLKDAYRNMRKTVHSLGNTQTRVRLVARLRKLSAELKTYGVKAQYL